MKLLVSEATGNLSHPYLFRTFVENTPKFSLNLSFKYPKNFKFYLRNNVDTLSFAIISFWKQNVTPLRLVRTGYVQGPIFGEY